ncbi:MAG: AraC family transcriptional regulator [Oscillospiraceae bacterium]|nr:AraC family transcriptional regulator [Oscillospiraceae bacterium]
MNAAINDIKNSDIPLCPYIRRAWYNILQPNEDIKERVIYDYELLFVKEGKARIEIEGNQYEAQQGDLFIFRPRQKHAIYVTYGERLVQPHIHFDLQYSPDRELVPISYDDLDDIPSDSKSWFRSDILDDFISPFPSCFHPKEPLYVEQMIFDIIHAVSYPSRFNEIRLAHLFFRLWEQLLEEMTYCERASRAKGSVSAAIKMFIERNDSRKLSLSDIENTLHFSGSYVSRIFKDSYGVSPMAYHTMMRVHKAKGMIQFTNMPLNEIAIATGFDSIQDFSRVYKKVEGVSPSALRRTKR